MKKKLYGAVLVQAVVMIAVSTVGLINVATLKCSGTASVCDDITSFGRRLAVIGFVFLILVYGIMCALAFFARRTASRVLTAVILGIEVLFVIGSVVAVAQAHGDVGPLVSGLAGLATGGMCTFFAAQALADR